jgi:hypothetical protein
MTVCTDAGSAKTALDRIVISQETLDRIAGVVSSPRSSYHAKLDELE